MPVASFYTAAAMSMEGGNIMLQDMKYAYFMCARCRYLRVTVCRVHWGY